MNWLPYNKSSFVYASINIKAIHKTDMIEKSMDYAQAIANIYKHHHANCY